MDNCLQKKHAWILEFQKKDQEHWSRLEKETRKDPQGEQAAEIITPPPWTITIGQDPSVFFVCEVFPPGVLLSISETLTVSEDHTQPEAEIQKRKKLLPRFRVTLHSSIPLSRDLPHCSYQVGGLDMMDGYLYAGVSWHCFGITFRIVDLLEDPLPGLPPLPEGKTPWLTVSSQGKTFLWKVHEAAAMPLSLYLEGETGTGKEVLAHLIHAWSPRHQGPFIPIHCGALPPNLVESELFGHLKGSFTGAIQSRTGVFMKAHQGTLFLDEIAELSLEMQAKLLRFLENGEIRPVGSDRITYSDVRVICATHQSLRQLVEQKKFRVDLYYRLASVTFEVPSLKERPEDVAYLARYFSKIFQKILLPSALECLESYSWEGNVRELKHVIERACRFTERAALDDGDFQFLFHKKHFSEPLLSLKAMEKKMLDQALHLSAGNRTRAAEMLGISRSAVFDRLKKAKTSAEVE